MKKILFIVLASIIVSCKNEAKPEKKEIVKEEVTTDSTVEIIDYSGLELLLNKNDDKTYVVNFWATWCKPCVEELPAFEKLYSTYKKNNVELILVSLDFPKQLEARVLPFIEKNNLTGKVVIMGDPDQNTWIPKVSEEWSGAIPATVIYNKDKRAFYEQSFSYDDLETELKKFITSN